MVFDDRFYAASRVTSSGADPTHHIKVTDGDHTIGFVITDQSGDRDERTFRRFPHADPAQPYLTEKQTSFGGGFGQASFEDNRAKYWQSLGVDTVKDQLVLGPAFHFGNGLMTRAQDNIAYDTFQWFGFGDMTEKWLAIPFTPAQNWTGTTYLKLWLKRGEGNPPSLRVRTYTNVAGEPAVQIHTQDIAPDDITTDPDGQWVRLTITDTYAYASGTQYWLVVTVAATAGDYWKIGTTVAIDGDGLRSGNGSTWASDAPELYFRIYGNNDNLTARWVDYKQQTYALCAWDNLDEAELFMNGWRGVADSNSGNLNSLVDATNGDWAAKITGDEVIKMVAGPASAEIEDYRKAASAINGDITVTPNWRITHTALGEDYIVQNSDYFQKVTHPVGYLSGYATGIEVSNGIMYITRGGKRGITIHEELNIGGVWNNTSNWNVRGNFQGEYIRAVRDPIEGEVLWVGYNQKDAGQWKPYVYMCKPTSYDQAAMNVQHVVNSYGMSYFHEYWESDVATYVTIAGGGNQADITVIVARVTAVAVNATGTGYSQNDKLTIVDPGSSQTAVVNVDTVDGEGKPTQYSIDTEGYDYTTGTKATTGGGGDDLAQVVISNVSEVSGLIAHINFKNPDGSQRTVDLRHMTNLLGIVKFSMVTAGNHKTLSSTDMKLVLDSVAGASESGFLTISVPDMISGTINDDRKKWELSLETTSGAEKCTAMGLTMTTQVKSYKITIMSTFLAWRDVEPITVGQVDGDNITGLEAFGDPETAWVFTEAGFGQIKNNRFMPVPMREIKVARHANNGKGHEVHDVYLLFTWKGRLQRYYRQNIEDLGPDFPKAMGDVAGEVVDVKTYPGRFYVAVDGGEDGKSMILCHKGGGWHEVYTSFTGERIRSLFVQAIEGKSDKLWASVGADLMWFPIELQTADLPANSDYKYRPSGNLDTSWIYTASRELDKVFRSILLTVDNAKDNDLGVTVYYKIDDEDAPWTKLNETIFSHSTTEHYLERFSGNTRGNRIRFRLELSTRVQSKSPIVRSIQSRMYRVPEVKFSYTWLSKLSTISVNLRGDEERTLGQFRTVQQAFDLIDFWAASLIPLRIESDIGAIHNKDVIIQPVPAQLLMIVHDEQIQEQSIQMSADDA